MSHQNLRSYFWMILAVALIMGRTANAQLVQDTSETTSVPATGNQTQQSAPDCSPKRLDKCVLNVAKDQAGIWTSPLRFHVDDFIWFAPFAAATAVSIHYDATVMQNYGFPTKTINFGHQVSRFGAPYVSFGAAGAMYLLGSVSDKPRMKHAGLLGAEAVVDAAILAEGLKLATNRDRPYQGDGTGKFWPHGTRAYNLDSSMPSSHVLAAWALARVISSDFDDKPWLKVLCYGAASTVSAARVLSRDHFPSDVVVGTTFGYLVGGYVVRRRSDQYWDRILSSVRPSFDAASHGVGVSLSVPVP